MQISNQWNRVFSVVLRLFLGGVLLWAAGHKWLQPQELAEQMRNYQILPESWTPFFAVGLLGLETVVGALLLAGVWAKEVAWSSLLLYLMFLGAVTSALARHLQISCGCLGVTSDPLTRWTFFRDLGLVLLSVVYIWSVYRQAKKNKLYT